MIYESLVVPKETVTSLTEIKRALLSFEKVFLLEPNDRDMIPPNSFLAAIGMPFLGINFGAVRPLGKISEYDNNFEKLTDELKLARKEGIIEVISTFNQQATQGTTIGAVPIGGYPLNPSFVLWLYRNIAQERNFLNIAIEDELKNLVSNKEFLFSISEKGQADKSINNIPAMPLLNGDFLDESLREPLTQIARGRIATAIKICGFCESKEIVPFFSDNSYTKIVNLLIQNTKKAIDTVKEDPFWTKRGRVLNIIHDEFIDETNLENMSMKDVLKLRTKVWKRQAEAREKLFESIRQIADETNDESKFEEICKDKVTKYKNISEELERERKVIKTKIICEAGMATLGIAGCLSQVQSPLGSMALTLIAGGIWAFQRTQTYAPELIKLKDKEKEFKRGAGFGLHNFYKNLR